MKSLQVDILCHIFPVLRHQDHFENDLRHQAFGIFYNRFKSPGIPTQNPVNQVFVSRIITKWVVHLFDQTGQPEYCCNKSKVKRRAKGNGKPLKSN